MVVYFSKGQAIHHVARQLFEIICTWLCTLIILDKIMMMITSTTIIRIASLPKKFSIIIVGFCKNKNLLLNVSLSCFLFQFPRVLYFSRMSNACCRHSDFVWLQKRVGCLEHKVITRLKVVVGQLQSQFMNYSGPR